MQVKRQPNRYLKIILISTAVMICVMSVLLVLVWRSSNRSETEGGSTEATLSFELTLEAIVAATLQKTPTYNFTDEQEVDHEQGDEFKVTFTPETKSRSEPEQVIEETDLPTQILTATALPSATPQPTPAVDPWVDEKLASMSLAQKVGQMILTGVNGTELTTNTCQFIRRVSPGGIVYIGTNISSPYTSQLDDLSHGLQNCISDGVGIPLLVAIDHEGLYVNRFPYESQMTIFPPAMAFGATQSPNLAYQAALASGMELRENGVTMVLGPVADVLTNYDNTVISTRSFGGDPAWVKLFVSESVRGYLEAGIVPVLKHYPGHGGVAGDSHTVLPVDESDKTQLLETHLVPFKAGIDSGAPSVMVSHVAFPALDSADLPASLLPWAYALLEDELGFSGFSMSDSLGMGAVSSTGLGVEAASIKAVNAGLDMLMLVSPDSAESVFNSVLDAARSGEIPIDRIDQAVHAILTVKHQNNLGNFPLGEGSTPDWQADQNLAYDIAYRAVSLHKNDLNLVPISKDVKNVLIIGPTDGWGLYPRLGNALSQHGIAYSALTYSGYWYGPIPETNLLQTVPARARYNDMVIVFTWDSHLNQFSFGDTFQIQLVSNLLDEGYNPVVIALKSPTDLLDFPDVKTYMATLGTTPGQLDAMVRILLGEDEPKGSIPLPGLP